jgi:cytochrome c
MEFAMNKTMNKPAAVSSFLARVVLIGGIGWALTAAPLASAADVAAAKELFKSNDCTKCHAPDKTKKGPSLKKMAEKYAGKADAEEKMIKAMTTGPKVKLDDGTEEDHKIIDTKDKAAMKNLIEWMRSH